jgi:uncharacterized phiE125 gp8 family phage protein
MSLKLVTDAVQEPFTVEEVKHHLRIEVSADDAMVAAYALAARQFVEAQTRRALMQQTWDYSIDYEYPYYGGYKCIRMPRNPVISVSSFKYIDDNGSEQTLAANQYTVVSREHYSYIVEAYDVTWPTLRTVPNAITIRFTAGYVDDTSSPQIPNPPHDLKQAVLLLTGHLYENREATTPMNMRDLPMGLQALMSPYMQADFA